MITAGFVRISSGVPMRERLAEVEHLDPLADAEDDAHVVLHEQHAAADVVAQLGDRLGELEALAIVEARGRLVEQQEARPDRDGAGDADAPLLAVRERRGRHVRHAPEAEAVEQRPRALARLAARQARAERAELDVLENGQFRKGRDVLERAHEPRRGEAVRRPGRHVPAAENHLSRRCAGRSARRRS